MRIIDLIEEKLTEYKEHFDKIEQHFNKENENFKALMRTDHDTIGKVLKCHLILENYLTSYLAFKFKGVDINNSKLTFAQKISLLPDSDLRVAFVKDGIIELNGIRNKYSHNLNYQVPILHFSRMLEVLKVSRKGIEYDNPINIIEEFTTVACTFLIVNPLEIDLLFQEVFEGLKESY